MPDPTMLSIQATAQGAQAAQAGQAAQAAQDAARAELDAARSALEAQQRALEAMAAREGVAQVQTTEGEVIRIGPGGEITRVGPDGKAVTVVDGAQTGADEIPPFLIDPQIPEGAVVISVAFFIMLAVIIVGLPLARAYARRMDRNTAGAPRASAEQAEQLRHIQTAVDAMAVEVERISENQRYVTRLLAEGTAPQGALLARQAAPEESGRP